VMYFLGLGFLINGDVVFLECQLFVQGGHQHDITDWVLRVSTFVVGSLKLPRSSSREVFDPEGGEDGQRFLCGLTFDDSDIDGKWCGFSDRTLVGRECRLCGLGGRGGSV
jgi:hypothetical protein